MRRGVSVGGQAVLLALTGFQLLTVTPTAQAQGQILLVASYLYRVPSCAFDVIVLYLGQANGSKTNQADRESG